MVERIYTTKCGDIHYWISENADRNVPQLVFLPGLTADHRLFDKQTDYYEEKYPVFVWDAPERVNSLIEGFIDSTT